MFTEYQDYQYLFHGISHASIVLKRLLRFEFNYKMCIKIFMSDFTTSA